MKIFDKKKNRFDLTYRQFDEADSFVVKVKTLYEFSLALVLISYERFFLIKNAQFHLLRR